MFNKIKNYKKTTAFTLIAIIGMINTLILTFHPIGFLYPLLPFIAYKLESSNYYAKQDQMMDDCRNDNEFDKLINEHKHN